MGYWIMSKVLRENKDWIFSPPQPNNQYERIEAFFSAHAYEPHRHDTYAIGRTLSGIQSFHYKGKMQHSSPGMTMVLHPDETHDGESGSHLGFQYRMVYIEPATIQRIIKGKPLPFIENGLSSDPRLFKASHAFLQNFENYLDPLEEEDALYDLAAALCDVASAPPRKSKNYDYQSAEQARAFIHSLSHTNISLASLEAASGRDRWSLSRDFRLLFGTSPHRYMTMQRLKHVKARLLQGESIVDAATAAGFYDQSHMTRHFTQAFGLAPGHWISIHRRL